MKPNFSLSLFLLLFAVAAQAQVMGNYEVQQNYVRPSQPRAVPKVVQIPNERIIEIAVNALSNQEASSYTAIFSVIQVGKTADETNNLINQRLDAFMREVESLGIPRKDIYLDMVNFLPKYEYDVSKKIFSKKTYTEIPKGFELQKNIHVRYTDPSVLDKVVTAAARQEIYDIVKVDYFVDKPQEVYSELRAAAFNYLAEIKKLYRSNGIILDSAAIISAENAWVAYPMDRYEKYRAFTTQAIDDNGKGIINEADKPVARFYDAVPANDYDIVINPAILEPAVQFSYKLVVRFTLPEKKPVVKTEIKKELMILTPTGELKAVRLD